KRTVGMTGYGRASQANPPLCVVRDRPATRRTLPKAVPARKAVSTARRLEGLKNVRSSGVAEWESGNASLDSGPVGRLAARTPTGSRRRLADPTEHRARAREPRLFHDNPGCRSADRFRVAHARRSEQTE